MFDRLNQIFAADKDEHIGIGGNGLPVSGSDATGIIKTVGHCSAEVVDGERSTKTRSVPINQVVRR